MELQVNIEEITKKVMEERRREEIQWHKERVVKLLQEKVELELRLLVINETLKKIDEFVKENPHLQE